MRGGVLWADLIREPVSSLVSNSLVAAQSIVEAGREM